LHLRRAPRNAHSWATGCFSNAFYNG
jgi:hypothetical protein